MQEINLFLTDEMKKKLESVIGFDIDCEFPYVPEAYRLKENNIPKNLWPVFMLRTKDGLDIARIDDSSGFLDTKDQLHLNMGEVRIMTLTKCLISIKDFRLDNGAILNYSKNKLSIIKDGKILKDITCQVEEVIRYIKVKLQVELQRAIEKRSTLTEEELQGLEL